MESPWIWWQGIKWHCFRYPSPPAARVALCLFWLAEMLGGDNLRCALMGEPSCTSSRCKREEVKYRPDSSGRAAAFFSFFLFPRNHRIFAKSYCPAGVSNIVWHACIGHWLASKSLQQQERERARSSAPPCHPPSHLSPHLHLLTHWRQIRPNRAVQLTAAIYPLW